MTKRATQATLAALLTATLVLPPSGFARSAPQNSGSAAAQAEHCFVKVETTNPKAPKDITNNEVPCSKVKWGDSAKTENLGKNDCLDDRARVGKVKLQRDKKTNQSSKTCVVQQYARAGSAPPQTQHK